MQRLGLKLPLALLALGSLLLVSSPAQAGGERGTVSCEMTFDIQTWSAFYRSGKGSGEIQCNNGQKERVQVRLRAGGLTFGKSDIQGAKAVFTGVRSIHSLFGGYAVASAHAGAGHAADAQVMKRRGVEVAVSGLGEGVDLGVSFGRFVIRPQR